VCSSDLPLPVEAAEWRHNGGATDYPGACVTFDDALDAWLHLEELRERACPYNLLYTPTRFYCLARRHQGSHPLASWAGGHAWYEMAGGVVAFNQTDFKTLGPDDISAELRQTAPT
jgi:hypothetical protein